jgi:hypothetical protein
MLRLLFHSHDDRRRLSRGFSSTRGAFGQQAGKDHEIIGEYRRADKQSEAVGAFSAAALHSAPAHQHRDASLDAGAKALALFERFRSLVGLALRVFTAAALRNAYRLDGALRTRRYVLLAEEAAIAGVRRKARR